MTIASKEHFLNLYVRCRPTLSEKKLTMFAVWILNFLAVITVSNGVAPGDENQLCPEIREQGILSAIAYSVNMRVLMDSWNYEALLNDHNRRAVWDEVNNDTSYMSRVSLTMHVVHFCVYADVNEIFL